jgi:alpha-L-fucosidase
VPRREFLLAALALPPLAAADAGASAAGPPAPYGPVPSARQLRWHEREIYGFLHFTVNTFTDKEWGYGDEPESVFDPTDFDADQIVGAAKAGGLTGLILTAKHHDGFCLWPSKLTEHSVKKSPWRGGKGDVVCEISEACRRQGLAFGIYLSPWDRNHPEYGRPSYLEYYRGQLRELMTSYGPIFEVWFDGANGGDGYYGGARETRTIDRRTYYDWPSTWQVVRDLQPEAVMFSDAGPDVRWVGNEKGVAGDPSWATLNRAEFAPGEADEARLNRGDRPGTHWLPAECDVSIRPGWFYHPGEDDEVKTPHDLLDLYFESVGRGASLLLNVPPDRRGRVHESDEQSLRGFRKLLDATFGTDLAGGPRDREQRARSRLPLRGGERPRRQARHVLVGRRRGDDAGAGPRAASTGHLRRGEPARAPAARAEDRGVGARRLVRRPLARARGGDGDREPPPLARRRRHHRPGAPAHHPGPRLPRALRAGAPPRAGRGEGPGLGEQGWEH